MVADVLVPTGVVVTANVAVVAFAAMVTLAGTDAAVVLLLDRVTTAPLAGAGPFSVNVPVEDVPPFTEAGFSVTVLNTAGVTTSAAVCVVPL